MEGFNRGDVVILKSGGPKMTIESKSDFDTDYICVWFEGTTVMRGSFPAETLELK